LSAAAVVVLILTVVITRLLTPTGSDHDRYHNKTFTCIQVVDGDTIDIGIPDGKYQNTRIRLWGVDTPETSKSPQGEGYFGPQAKEFTRSLVDGKQVRVVLTTKRTRGKYGRLLAYVYIGDSDTMLNEELVIQGYAYADHRFDHPWKQRFLDLEQRARKSKAGLWAEVKPEQYPAWRQSYEKWMAGKDLDRKDAKTCPE
jgi:micrococcal nuclease